MNYIQEINSFYQRQETNPLSSHAANLWHALMHINNRAGWKTRFTASISVICSKSGLTNSTFKRARTELHSKGYIDYESRSGNQSAIYAIISGHQKDEDHGVVQNITMDEQEQRKVPKKGKVPNEMQFTRQSHLDYKHQEQSKNITILTVSEQEQSKQGKDLNHNVGPLLKQKETKQDPSTAAEDVIAFFNENFGKAKPYIVSEMMKWVDRVGQSLVSIAMKRTLDRGKGTWGYVKAILQDWKVKGLKTVAEAESEIDRFSRQRKQIKEMPGEIVPDWFDERGAKQAELMAGNMNE